MKKLVAVIFIVQALILAGCTTLSTDKEKIYSFLEEVVKMEKDFALQQQPLAELEKQEGQLYAEIIQYSSENQEKISELAKLAIQVIEDKGEIIVIEKESMEKSKEKFNDINKLIKKIDEENISSILKDMNNLMSERYNQYEELNSTYEDLLVLEKELYELFANGKMTLNLLEEKIIVINEHYELINELNTTFNDLTVKYNERKLDLYNDLEIEITE